MGSAKQGLIDWFAASLASRGDVQSEIVAGLVKSMNSQGRAVAINGDTGSAGPIALINGTYSHASEYDDFHVDAVLHIGGATLAAALALAMDRGQTGMDVLKAFTAGFEVSTRLSMNSIGLEICNADWHATAVIGHISSAVACAYLLRLDPVKTQHALGFAAAQISGLQSSSGTIAKPLVIGKAALAGILAAGLAERGGVAPTLFFNGPKSIFATLVDSNHIPQVSGLNDSWEITRNSFKPYGACQATHAGYDAGRLIAQSVRPEDIKSIRVRTNPFNPKIAWREQPTTPFECKFSVKHVVAMALCGHGANPSDFTAERVVDPRIVAVRDKIELAPTDELSRTAAIIEITTHSGEAKSATVLNALGSLENPMTVADVDEKFMSVASEKLGSVAKTMLDALKRFYEKGALDEVAHILKDSKKA